MSGSRFEIYLDLLLEVLQNSNFETIAHNANSICSKRSFSVPSLSGICITQAMDDKIIKYELSKGMKR